MKNKFLLLTFVPLFISSCAELNSALESVNKSMGGISERSMPKLQSASAIKICDDFRANEIAAKNRWNNAYVSFKGKIDTIYQDEWGNSNVNVRVNHKIRVLATLKKGYSIEKVKKGNSINVKGFVSNVMHTGSCNILLEESSI